MMLCMKPSPISRHVPTVTINHSGRTRVNYKLRKLYSKKRSLWRLYKKTRSASILTRYKNCCSDCRREVHLSAVRRESQLLDDNNLGKFFRFCNSKLNSRTNVGAIKLQNGQITCDPQLKAETINNYFSSVFSLDNGSISTPSASPDPSDALSCSNANNVTKPRCHKVDFNSHVVLHSLGKLASKTSCGPGQIPAIFLKKQALQLAYPLAELFSKSFQDGPIPDLWRLAHVTPIFKKPIQPIQPTTALYP